MTTTAPTDAPGETSSRTVRLAWWGLAGGAALVVLVTVVPGLIGLDTHAREATDGQTVVPFLRAYLRAPVLGPGTAPAVLLGVAGVAYGARVADRVPWRWLLVLTWVVGVAWLLSLALVDGAEGIERSQRFHDEYLVNAREVDDVGVMVRTYVDRIPGDVPDPWPAHPAGHPPGALLFFVLVVRLGLTSPLAVGIAVVLVAATAVPGVLVAVRALGEEATARRAAPYVVLAPAAIFAAVSGDAVFAAVAAWGLACLAIATTRGGPAQLAWGGLAGLLLGLTVFLSYGLVLIGVLALAVLLAGRSWRPLAPALVGALAVTLAFGAAGFWWWQGYGPLHDRYWEGIAADRPQAYWFFGDLAALLVSAGPVLAAGIAVALGRLRETARTRVPLAAWLGLAAAATVLLADASRMSKAEVERIWLPFVPWLLLTSTLLPPRWQRPALAAQVAVALVAQHVLLTEW